ncbi:MAG: Spermidine synthase [candidate division BRC1 bacterium ADurb.BinA364]|nr:MAG: Spermidine synthase [candidate division BRC1 bacterium ADurb.BinA364]
MAALYMLMAVLAIHADAQSGAAARLLHIVIALAAAAALYLRLPARNEAFANVLLKERNVIAYKEGPLATVSVAEDSIGYRQLAIDGIGVAGTNRIMLTDQKSLAHLPALLLPAPKSVLTVGFGSGGASYSYTLYPELETIRCVEISETVLLPEIQREMLASNRGLLDRWLSGEEPRFGVVLADARSYLRFTEERYDSIATDCTDLRYKSNANLYDLEYFQLCRDRLAEDGMVVVWMPLGGLTDDLFKAALGTFRQVFEEMHVWYFNNDMVHYILLAGFQKPLRIDYAQVAERLARPQIAGDLGEIGLENPDKFLGCYVTGGEPLARLLEGARINSENRPIIEFEAPLSPYGGNLIWNNLRTLYDNRQSVLEIVDPATIPREAAERIRRFEAAAPTIAKALEAKFDFDYAAMMRRCLEARAIAPDDPSIDYIEKMVDERKAFAMSADKTIGGWRLGIAEYERGDFEKAISYFDAALNPNRPKALGTEEERRKALTLSAVFAGRASLNLGRAAAAPQYLRLALEHAAPFPELAEYAEEVLGTLRPSADLAPTAPQESGAIPPVSEDDAETTPALAAAERNDR